MFIDSHLLCCEKPTRDYVIFWTNIISSTSIDENFIYFDKLVLQSKRFTTPGCPAANQPATAGTSPGSASPHRSASQHRQPSHPGSQPANQSGNHKSGPDKDVNREDSHKAYKKHNSKSHNTQGKHTFCRVTVSHIYSVWLSYNALFIRNWRFFSSNSSCVIPTQWAQASLWGCRFPPSWVAVPFFWFASWVSQATSHIPLFPQLHVLCQRGYHLAGHPCQPLVVFLESHLVASIFTRSIIITRKHNLIRLMRNVRSMENPRNLSCARNQQNHVRYKEHEKH